MLLVKCVQNELPCTCWGMPGCGQLAALPGVVPGPSPQRSDPPCCRRPFSRSAKSPEKSASRLTDCPHLPALQKKRPGTPSKPPQRRPGSAASTGAVKRKRGAAAADSDDEDDFKERQRAAKRKAPAAAKKAATKKAPEGGRGLRAAFLGLLHCITNAAVVLRTSSLHVALTATRCLSPPDSQNQQRTRTMLSRRARGGRLSRLRRARSRGPRGTKPSQTAAWTVPATQVGFKGGFKWGAVPAALCSSWHGQGRQFAARVGRDTDSSTCLNSSPARGVCVCPVPGLQVVQRRLVGGDASSQRRAWRLRGCASSGCCRHSGCPKRTQSWVAAPLPLAAECHSYSPCQNCRRGYAAAAAQNCCQGMSQISLASSLRRMAAAALVCYQLRERVAFSSCAWLCIP